MEFQRGVVTGDLKKLGATEKTGTRITFRPDAEIFPDIEFDFDILSRRLQELAFLNAGIRIHIADDRTGQTDEYFYEQGLIEFVNYLNRTEDVLFSQVISLDGVQESDDGEVEVDVALQYTTGTNESIRTYANNINNLEGGTHLSGFRSALTRTVNLSLIHISEPTRLV